MATALTATSQAARQLVARHLAPAALGFSAAMLLGAAGLGLGYLYVQLAGNYRPVIAAAPSTTVVAPPAAVIEASGGPDEVVALVVSALPPSADPASFRRAPGIRRPVEGGWVSSHYGQRLDPFTGLPAVHRGLDFAGLDNSSILAVAPGVVTWSGPQAGYGNLIEIDHGRGWVTRYGHNASNLVQAGDYVKPGQTIALMGATGRATGTHLHFEVLYRGRYQNPARFVPRAT